MGQSGPGVSATGKHLRLKILFPNTLNNAGQKKRSEISYLSNLKQGK